MIIFMSNGFEIFEISGQLHRKQNEFPVEGLKKFEPRSILSSFCLRTLDEIGMQHLTGASLDSQSITHTHNSLRPRFTGNAAQMPAVQVCSL